MVATKAIRCTLQGESENTSYSVILCIFSASPENKCSGDFVCGQVVMGGKESKLLVMVKSKHENTQDRMKWAAI